MSGYGLRRPPVNVVGTGGSSYDDDIETRKSCPRCGIVLIFREDINSLFCKKCAYKPPLPEISKSPTANTQESEEEEEEQLEEDPLSTVDGLQTKIGQRGTSLEEDFDNAIRIRPIANSGRRSDQLQKDAGKRGIHGWDADMERIVERGGNIIFSSEEVSSDGTYNTGDYNRRKTWNRQQR